MKPEQSLQVLHQAAGLAKLTKIEHIQCDEAMKVLTEALAKKTKKPKPDA